MRTRVSFLRHIEVLKSLAGPLSCDRDKLAFISKASRARRTASAELHRL